MINQPDPLLDARIAHLAATLDAAEVARDLAQHLSRDQVAADLARVRWAAQRGTHIGVTPADRQTVAAACSRINRIVFDSPNAPDPSTIRVAPMTRSLEHRVAALAQRADRWRASFRAEAS